MHCNKLTHKVKHVIVRVRSFAQTKGFGMPRVIIRLEYGEVPDKNILMLRDEMPRIISEVLKVEREEVEVLISNFGPRDLNTPPIAIDVVTGTGKKSWRLRNRAKLAAEIEFMAWETCLIKNKLIDGKSYVWLMVVGSSFVPIGKPELKR